MAGAISGTTYAALAAMIAGAGLQYKASTDAQKRQQEQIRNGLASQRELQLQAEKRALGAAEKFATPERQAEQSQIADQITQELIAPVSESQAIRSQQQSTQGNVSNDYRSAKAASDINTMKAAQGLARMLGKTTSGNRLRMNENIRMLDTGMDIDRLASFSRGQGGADQIAIQQAGQVDPGMVLAGSVLQGAGTAGMMAGAGAAGGANYGGLPSYSAEAAVSGAQTPAWNSVFTQVPGRAAASTGFVASFGNTAKKLYAGMAK